MTKKIELGQFFTKRDSWLRPHIQAFFDSVKFNRIVDPFAGQGHLLKVFESKHKTMGYDIDTTLNWSINDGLLSIPSHKDDICVTNPPYLAKTTSTRFKRVGTFKYFTLYPQFNDLYLMGLEQCLKSFDYGVAIIPETYLLCSKKSKRIITATVLEDNPFDDTEFPVIVITWGPGNRDDYDLYKDSLYLGTQNSLMTKIPAKNKKRSIIEFNNPAGNLGIVCIDRPDKIGGIKFTTPDKIKGPIKVSSRTATVVNVNSAVDTHRLINTCNLILKKYREDTFDVFMAPFKGNDTNGQRRRRLDFATARLIIENALAELETPQQIIS